MINRSLTRRSFLPAGLAVGGLGLRLAEARAADPPPSAPMAPTASSAPAGLTAAPTSMAGVSPRLTVHAIDTYHGITGAGLEYELSRHEGDRWVKLTSTVALAGGRPADPLLLGDTYRAGRYEILLHLDRYFAAMGARLPTPPFLSQVALRFRIHDATQRTHVAALFSPWGYSYYRGS